MKSDLDELIEFYEKERDALKKAIDEYVKELDYVYASYQQAALFQVDNTLDNLYKMKIPHFEEIREFERLKKIAERMDEFDISKFIKEYYEKQVEQDEIRIKQLKEQGAKPFHDEQLIDNALFDLVEGRNNGFALVIKERSTAIEFYNSNGNIEILLLISETDGYSPNIEYEDDATDKVSRPFEGLGFRYENDIYTCRFPLSKFKDAQEMKVLLSRLFYDVLHYNPKYENVELIIY